MIKLLTSRPPSHSAGIRYMVVVAILLTLIQLHLSYDSTYLSSWKWSSGNDSADNAVSHTGSIIEGCDGLTGSDRVVVTLKTGATEAVKKVPTILNTSLRCAPHVYVFSDLPQKIGQTELYDSLDTVSESVMNENSDFDLYRKQLELRDPEKIMEELSELRDPREPGYSAAWTLDKYKIMHLIEKAWSLKPDMDFYLHVEADSYVIWPSLITWIQRLDPSKKFYMGSAALINDVPFGHGGSGYLMSREAMRSFVVDHNGTAAKWDPRLSNECCGDYTLALALKEYDMPVMNAWPTFNGETQYTIPFGEDHWCQPLVTLHHISPAEAEELASFEAKREKRSSPLLYAELFKDLMLSKIPAEAADWDNISNDGTVPDVDSEDACFTACQYIPNCLQARYDGTICLIGTDHVSIGRKLTGWKSTWNKTRIEAWAKSQKQCGEPEFPFEKWPSSSWFAGAP
ncbi:unnamed protein product [Diplocarpon coronariae]|uniref:Glycosyltransferase family 31 protein n=1 Tax=Diplocarpon coronariae TaxID=2795749 RepID=A0A218YZ35_9HELO|nr:hypothetical protein B2J93_3368 [Marssonina coronariae]